MRRPSRDETLHGTRDGQLAVDRTLVERFGLTEREAACATLLVEGQSVRSIAKRLEISASTAEKHLGGLRRKLGAQTTREAVVTLVRLESDRSPGFSRGEGGLLPAVGELWDEGTSQFLARLRAAESLEEMLDVSLAAMCEEGVATLLYTFLPFSASTFRRDQGIERVCPDDSLAATLWAHRAWGAATVSARLFREPEASVLVDANAADGSPDGIAMPPGLASAFRERGLRHSLVVGIPFGCGYAATSALYRATHAIASPGDRARRVRSLRGTLARVQSAAFSFGALARTANLTLRERDALTLLAEGHTAKSAAAALPSSERAFGQLLKSARAKLEAKTTGEAIAKAMALNALVFL